MTTCIQSQGKQSETQGDGSNYFQDDTAEGGGIIYDVSDDHAVGHPTEGRFR